MSKNISRTGRYILFALIGLIVLFAFIIIAIKLYNKYNKPFSWKYRQEIEAIIEDCSLNSIDYSDIIASENGYTVRFMINCDMINDAILYDTVKVFDAIEKLAKDPEHPMYQKNLSIEVCPDKSYSSCELSICGRYNDNILDINITNSTVQDFYCLNELKYGDVNLTVVHDEILKPEDILKVNDLSALSIIDWYDVSSDAHKKIILDDTMIGKFKAQNPKITIHNN